MPAAEGVFPKADNDPFYGSEANAVSYTNLLAGENLTAGNVVYIKKSDGKVYVSDTGTADDIRADGIVTNSPLLGATAYVKIGGNYVTSGLTANEVYYLGASGAVSTTYSAVQVGVATSTTNLYIHIVQDDKDIVGTIKPWAKSLTGVPSLTAFWVECGSQGALSDAESPINGQTIPNLNVTQRFLRGAATSGTTGGEDTHILTTAELAAHTHTIGIINTGTSAGSTAAWGSSSVNTSYTSGSAGSGTAHENKPAYYQVVYIIKIK